MSQPRSGSLGYTGQRWGQSLHKGLGAKGAQKAPFSQRRGELSACQWWGQKKREAKLLQRKSNTPLLTGLATWEASLIPGCLKELERV